MKKKILPVFGTDIRHDVLVEELEDEWDTVGKHQVLRDNLKLQEKRRRQCEELVSVLEPKYFDKYTFYTVLCGLKPFYR